MKILVSNDDGYYASGLAVLCRTLQQLGHEVSVVAPDRDNSGASNSLTLAAPLRVTSIAKNFWSVNGTPTDCVHIGITGLLEKDPDIVISGINSGSNLGDDVLYSGTVAAAMEGRFLGYPAIAVSLASESLLHYDTAGKVIERLLEEILDNTIPADTILNVNVPDVAWDCLQGWEITRLGKRHKSEPVIESSDPKGRPIYWIGPPGEKQDAGPGTDFHAIANNIVSITPIKVDLTRHDVLELLRQGFGALK